jgi:flagellar biosynthetic protein FliQ
MLVAPLLAAAMAVGLVVSLVQAVTSIHEQTLTFVPKLVGIMVVLSLVGPWIFVQLMTFATSLLESFPNYVH